MTRRTPRKAALVSASVEETNDNRTKDDNIWRDRAVIREVGCIIGIYEAGKTMWEIQSIFLVKGNNRRRGRQWLFWINNLNIWITCQILENSKETGKSKSIWHGLESSKTRKCVWNLWTGNSSNVKLFTINQYDPPYLISKLFNSSAVACMEFSKNSSSKFLSVCKDVLTRLKCWRHGKWGSTISRMCFVLSIELIIQRFKN